MAEGAETQESIKEKSMRQGKSALGIVQKYHPGVIKVVDSKKSLTISVTRADFRRASSKSPSQCAMAKAVQHQHDGAIISTSVAYVIDGNKAVRYKVPTSLSREIVAFDRHAGFAPGEYRLTAPSKMERLNRPNDGRGKNGGGHGATKQRYHRTAGIRSL
jgi:hypothetical protein